jgi:hypothetical protein
MHVRLFAAATVGDVTVPPGDYSARAVPKPGGVGSVVELKGDQFEGISADREVWEQLGAEFVLGQ